MHRAINLIDTHVIILLLIKEVNKASGAFLVPILLAYRTEIR